MGEGLAAAFQEDAFVFTWLRLQKAVGKLIASISHSAAQPAIAPAAQRLRGVSDQVQALSHALLHCQHNRELDYIVAPKETVLTSIVTEHLAATASLSSGNETVQVAACGH